MGDDVEVEKQAELLGAMANAKRLAILTHLLDNEITVGQLAILVDLSQSALSQHLAKLREQALVETRRDAQTIYYTTRNEGVRRLLQTLKDIYCAPVEALRKAS